MTNEINNFFKCLRQGKKYEDIFLSYITYDSYNFSPDGCKEYDIKTTTNGIELYYEIKSDNISYNSGNMCIEYLYKGQPSGINATIADFWGYFVLKPNKEFDLYVIPTFELKQLLKDNKKYIRDIKGGDNRNSNLYLISLSLLEKYIINNNNCIENDKK
jgi:hypothetical protein